MSVYYIQKEYVTASTRRISSPVSNMISFDIPVDGDIVEISVIGDSGSGTSTFSVDLNGVPLYAGAARPSIATTETSDTKTGLSDAVLFEDRLSLSLVEVTGGGLFPRLTFIVKIDDGIAPLGDLDDLGDVNTAGVADGDALLYDSGTSTWLPGAVSGGASALDDLTDVVITTPSTGAILKYNGTAWIDDTNNLDGLSDVVISTPSTGQVLKYNGTNWVNDTDATGGSTLGVFNPDIPYTSPSTEDDEFDAGSLNGKWTAIAGVTAPTLNWDIPNMIGGTRGASGQLCGYYQSKTGSITIRAKVLNNYNAVNQSVGIFMRESGPHFTSIRVSETQVVVEEWINATAVYLAKSTITMRTDTYRQDPVWLQMVYNGTSIVFSISADGINFNPVYTNSTAFPFGGTMDGFGICWVGGASTPTNPARIDWFRVLQGNYTGKNI